ncbi:hypothetical protein D3C75_880860 [compost metagenome]
MKGSALHGIRIELFQAFQPVVRIIFPAELLSGNSGDKGPQNSNIGIIGSDIPLDNRLTGIIHRTDRCLAQLLRKTVPMTRQSLNQPAAAEIGPVPVRRRHHGQRLFIEPGPDAKGGLAPIRILQRNHLCDNAEGPFLPFN